MGEFNIDDVKHWTFLQKARLSEYQKCLTDPDKGKRISDQECVCCFYGSRIGGAAMTKSNCRMCDNEMMFWSTATDRLCKECATAHDLCKQCGADINYNTRTKL